MPATLTTLLQSIIGFGGVVFLAGTIAVVAGFLSLYLMTRLIHPLHRREVERSLHEQRETERRYGTA